jgi:two-component system sensor histidine kinase KdpD
VRWRRVTEVLAGVGIVLAFGLVARAFNADLAAAALLLLVAVIVASFLGAPSAVASAVIAFLVLNWFFTPPKHSLAIDKTDDVVALVVFAVTAALLSFLVSRLASLATAARRNEREAALRIDLTNRLLSGANVDDALGQAATKLGELFNFTDCRLIAGEPPADEHLNIRIDSHGVTLVAHADDELDAPDRAQIEALLAGIGAGVDRLRLQDEVREARIVAEIGKQRAGFLSAISHNLRTPLTAVKASADTLLSSWSRLEPEERRELLETISDEAERLERLVRNTLELSRIRAGALEAHAEPVDIADLVQHAVRRLRPITRAHRVRLDVADDLPAVALDVTMAEQILLNLLENALRFAPPGSEILVGADAPDADHVDVRVVDHGPGVPAEARDRIFEEFQSAETRPDRTGTGLGLAIVRALVLAHGGSVRYEDTPGGGATFVCVFPREAP